MNYDFTIEQAEFKMFRDFVHDRFGFFLKDDKRSFVQMKLYPRVLALGLESFREYLQFLKYGPTGEEETILVMSLLTNTETYFFREMPQLELLRDTVLPRIREEKMKTGDKKIKIVSAGCSSGEEVYTLAMLVFETGVFFWGWEVKVIGLDINRRALDKAESGVYTKHSFRMTPDAYKKKFFLNSSSDYRVKDSIKRMTEFKHGNVTSESTWRDVRDVDVLLCRNVIIYFSEQKIKDTMRNLSRSLAPGGYLFLGHSETLNGCQEDFTVERFPSAIIYKKR